MISDPLAKFLSLPVLLFWLGPAALLALGALYSLGSWLWIRLHPRVLPPVGGETSRALGPV